MDNSNRIIVDILNPLKPYEIFLFGSRARNTANETSDYDIMVFWETKRFPRSKYESNEEFSVRMFDLSDDLSNKLKAPVDMVVMRYIDKWVNNISVHDNTFYECVRSEYISLLNNGGIELLDVSEKIGLFKS